ncbi:hypothetical protein J437_LFUL019303 [Ladona fulva]|uniref:Uncharacterized protein n=1 Tax=Ladona fulva TaxID=123851 RepID=A0A8K0KTN2_LADFU|nr:hypothetical protein J437_LFUL019303 [Ladona fulva]
MYHCYLVWSGAGENLLTTTDDQNASQVLSEESPMIKPRDVAPQGEVGPPSTANHLRPWGQLSVGPIGEGGPGLLSSCASPTILLHAQPWQPQPVLGLTHAQESVHSNTSSSNMPASSFPGQHSPAHLIFLRDEQDESAEALETRSACVV